MVFPKVVLADINPPRENFDISINEDRSQCGDGIYASKKVINVGKGIILSWETLIKGKFSTLKC